MSEGGDDDMKRTEITVEILNDIRQELRELRGGVQDTNTKARGASRGHHARFDARTRRMSESEVRAATVMTTLSGEVRELMMFLRAQSDLRTRVERCERDIADFTRT